MHVICADGLGGCLSAVSFADLYLKKGYNLSFEEIHLYFICSKPVYDALERTCLNINEFYFHHYEDNITDINLAAKLKSENKERIYVLTPDYMGDLDQFSIRNTNISWREVQENRFLDYHLKPKEKNCFLGLLTAQNGNSYQFTQQLIEKLCSENPYWTFYYANVKEWSNKNITQDLDLKELGQKYSNFCAYTPNSLSEDLVSLIDAMNMCIGVDNGINNFFYRLGRERILLDSRFGSRAFEVRWRGTTKDSIPINASPASIARLFKIITKNPEVTAVDKWFLWNNEHAFENLGYKTKVRWNE